MAVVYSGAAVTIAADAAQDSADGCFRTFLQNKHGRNIAVTIPCINDQGLDCTVYVRNATRRDFWTDLEHIPIDQHPDILPSPLGLRGWVLQERLLSPRILHYGPIEQTWECRSQVACECTPIPEHIHYDKESPARMQYRARTAGKMIPVG
jgi:hypothetical protein